MTISTSVAMDFRAWRKSVKLPGKCPHADMPPDELFSREVDCCRVHGDLLGTEEVPLCRSLEKESEVYRFIWRSSFDGDAIVSIAHNKDAITLCWKYNCFREAAPDDSPAVLALSATDWYLIQDYIDKVKFWSLDCGKQSPKGFDGALWLIEGRAKDFYHAVVRWSPKGPMRDLGGLFFTLSGPPLASIVLY